MACLLEPQVRIRENDNPNSEARKNDERSNDQVSLCCFLVRCHAVAGRRRVLRASFLICRSVLLVVIAQMCCSALAQAQTPSMTGTWNVDITFANERHHSLLFEAQGDGKGSLQLTDPAAKVWGATSLRKQSGVGAKETRDLLRASGIYAGNVGRDAGTLTCKGKFESADLISGEVEFSPSVGDRPSRHGTFKAVRSKTYALENFARLAAVAGSARELRCVVASLVAGRHFKNGARTRADSESLRKIVTALLPFASKSLPFPTG